MKLASILYEPKGYETERKLWKKHMAQQTTYSYACITAKRGKATMKVLYEMFFNCNVAVACSDSRQKAECVAKSVYIHKHIIWYTKIKRDERPKSEINERDQTLT